MDRDRSWMYCRMDQASFINDEFFKGVEEFITFAYSQNSVINGDSIRCPCHRCENSRFQISDTVRRHLYYNGFVAGYTTWTFHGENEIGQTSRREDDNVEIGYQAESQNPYAQMVIDFVGPTFNILDYHDSEASFVEEDPNPKAAKFYSLLNDADEPLYEGCSKYTRLSALCHLLNCKSEFNMSEACFDRLMVMLKNMLPEDECLPENFYRMKQKMKSLGVGYEKIHVCQNNCMLFYKEAAELDHCSICGHPRYKVRQLEKSKKGRQKMIPCKILRYLPLIPRLQRLYMSAKTAENMTWHATNQSTDGVLRHPVDGEAWQHFSETYPSFAAEPRNVRLGLCANGFSPFGPAAKPYSIWPVMIVVYNLPPWMCMKQSYIFLNMVILGKKSPCQNIDVFLRPLIDELKELWNDGVPTYDAFKKQNFTMRASLLRTIKDFPAYGMLSGWSTHGTLSCPYCMEHIKSFRLVHARKPCFFYCHRQFLRSDHPFRRQKYNFRKRVEHDYPIPRLSGQEILTRLNSIPNITFGSKCSEEKLLGFGEIHNWVKKSIFWELPYWHTNLIRHNLDLMHIERNVFENVFNTMMDIKGKTKDNIKARKDMQMHCKRKELELVETNGRVYMPQASYTLSKEERRRVCAWVKQLKLPDGFVSNISRCVNEVDCKFYGLKSHDCHVFLQRLLPIAIRDMVPNSVYDAVIELSHFFRDLCSTEIQVDHINRLEVSIVETICKLEKIFPPGFFNSMEHLPIHLPYEAKVGGPVHYRWMYPFERFLHHLKKKVKNQACVEGSICEAYIIEEISSFCSMYFEPTIETRLNRVSRNDDGGDVESMGRLSIFCQSGRLFNSLNSTRFLEEEEHYAAELYVLLNCEEIYPYVKMFDENMKTELVNISDKELEKLRDTRFPKWFRQFVAEHKDEVDPRIIEMSHGPGRIVQCYKGYFVNGFKFHTQDYGQNRSTRNSGVCVKGSCHNDYEKEFYGVLVDIIQLEYFGVGNRVVLFKCHWFDTEKGVKVDSRHGLVEIKHNSVLLSNEPFVLADQAQQVYYSPYPSNKRDRRDWWAVFKTKARSTFHLSTKENHGENTTNFNEENFQEDEVFIPTNIVPTDDLESPIVLVNGRFEEVNSFVEEEEEDDDELDEDEEAGEDEDEAEYEDEDDEDGAEYEDDEENEFSYSDND